MAAEVEIVINARDDASGVLGGLGGTLSNLGNIVTGIKSAFDLVGGAIDATVGFFQPFVQSASESELAVAQLEGVLRATGGAAGLTSQELQDLADRLQGITRFSDETILSGTNLLLTFRNIGEETLPRTIEAMLDMAEIFGSVDSAAMQLGKALNEPATMLGSLQRAGVTFTEEQENMIKAFVEMGDVASAQNIILAEVEAQVGGLSEAMGSTFAGQLEIARNKLDSVKETIGAALLPVMTDLLTKFSEFANSPAVTSFVTNVVDALGKLIDFLSNPENLDFATLAESFTKWTDSIDWQAVSQNLAEGINQMDWVLIGDNVRRGLIFILEGLGTIVEEVDWSGLGSALAGAFGELFAGLVGQGSFDQVKDVIRNSIMDAVNNLKASMFGFGQQVGSNLVMGVITGLNAMTGNLLFTISNIIDTFINTVKSLLGIASPSTVFFNIASDIVAGFVDGLNLLGNILGGGTSAGGLGTAGGGTAGGTTTGGLSSGSVVNNYYGPVYFGAAGEPGAYYDCPSPHPLVASSGNQLVTSGF